MSLDPRPRVSCSDLSVAERKAARQAADPLRVDSHCRVRAEPVRSRHRGPAGLKGESLAAFQLPLLAQERTWEASRVTLHFMRDKEISRVDSGRVGRRTLAAEKLREVHGITDAGVLNQKAAWNPRAPASDGRFRRE
jgi:hypothetical protein